MSKIKSILLLFSIIVLMTACNQDSSESENTSRNNQEQEQSIEYANDNNNNNTNTFKIKDTEKVKQIRLSYSVEKPQSSNIKHPNSILKIVFSSDSANSAFKDKFLESSITTQIDISPKISGTWQVDTIGKVVTFTPNKEWQPNTKYTVTMDKEIFNPYYTFNKFQAEFKTDPFTANIDSENTDVDFNANKQSYKFHVSFNYLFNQKEFKEKAQLKLNDADLKYKTIFDKDGYGVSIESAKFDMLDSKSQSILFSLPRISAADGGTSLQYEIHHTHKIEKIDYSSTLTVTRLQSSTVKDSNGNPHKGFTISFSDPVSITDLMKHMKLSTNYGHGAVNVGIKPVYTGNSSDIVHTFIITDRDIPDSQSINIIISKHLYSSSGLILGSDYMGILSVPSLKAGVSILQKGSILSLKNDKKFTFETRGISTLDVEVGHVFPEQLQHIINFTSTQGLGDIKFDTSILNTSNFSEYKHVLLPLASNDLTYPSYATIDIGEYAGNKPGLYYIKAQGLDKTNKPLRSYSYYDDYYDYEYGYGESDYNRISTEVSRFILVTDMYIIAKQNKLRQTDIFLASISKGEAVKNAKIEVIGINGLPIVSGNTDNQGHFSYELPKDNGKNPAIAIIAKKNDDLTYLPLSYNREVNYSKFDIDGEYYRTTNMLKAFTFTDRGIYRPGEKVNISTIIKDILWKQNLEGMPVLIKILSPKNEVVLEEKHSLNKTAFIETEFTTQNHFTTGIYNALIYISREDGSDDGNGMLMLGKTSFELREFDTDTIRVENKLKESSLKGWIKPDKLTAYIKADNMIGTPAIDRRVHAKFAFSPYVYYFKEYKDYIFSDPYIERVSTLSKTYKQDLKDTVTNKSGEAEYDLSSYFTDYVYGTYLLEFTGEVYEKGSGDGVASYSKTLVSPADYLVGYKTDNYLGYLNTNESAVVNFIAVDKDLNKIKLDNLKYRVIQITYLNQLIKDQDDRYRYSYVKKYNVLNSGNIEIGKDGKNIELPTNSAGDFIYEVVDKNNIVVGKVQYYVSGNENINTGFSRDSVLSLKLDKAEYKAGDTINLNITAPYTGYGLITLEKEKVYAYKWFKINTNSATESIKIPNSMDGNGYVNISFVRDIESKEILNNPFSYAVAPFKIDNSNRKINITLETPDYVSPGDNVIVKYKVNKSGKILIYGVDEGILQVANYKIPDPLNYFIKKIALTVNTLQTADLILPDYKIMLDVYGIGGGERLNNTSQMEQAVNTRLNPFARVTEAPAAYWSKILDVKADENNEVSIPVPSYFNGSMKIIAIAVSQDSLGSSSASFVSRTNVVLTPNMPYAVLKDDKFKLSVGVSNLIEESNSSSIKITAQPSKHFTIIGDSSKTVTVKKGEEGIVLFDVVVNDEYGSGEIILQAENEHLKKPITAKLTSSVRPSSIYRTDIAMGTFKKNSHTIKIKPRDMVDLAVKRNIVVSSNPLYAVAGISNYLESYPYGCTEQITSKIYPVIMLATVNNKKDSKEVQQVYDAYIKELTKRQKGQLGFTYWSGGSYVNNIASIYASQFLIDAKELGYTVPKALYNNAISYLTNITFGHPNDDYEALNMAYATYLLARHGIVNARILNVLEEYLEKNNKKESLAAAYIGAAYILYKNEEKGRELLLASVPKYKRHFFSIDFNDSLSNTARYLYLAGKHAPDIVKKHNKLVYKILDEINDGYYNSFSGALSLASLYYAGSGEDTNIKLEGKGLKTSEEKGNQAVFSADTKEIKVSGSEPGPLGYFYYITTSGFDKNIPEQVSNGISISKTFYNENGQVITSGKQGDEVTVQLKVESNYNNYDYTMLAVTDLIPGGTEIITNNKVSVKNSNLENYEFREDRALIYLNLKNKTKAVISYKIKLLSSGDFTVVPSYVESLYNSEINAVGKSSSFIINEAY